MGEAYSRLYHRFAREFPDVYADDHALASWVRLLLVADASWPMHPPLPRSARARSLSMLVGAGLVIVDGDSYTVLGLDAERNRRSDAGRTGAVVRWQNERNAVAMPRRDETSTRQEEVDTPPPPAERGRREDGTNPRANGSAPRQNGANPRAKGTSCRQVRQSRKTGPSALGDVLRRANEMGRP